jgi:hypothetical protein
MEDVEMNEYFDARIEDISIQRFEEIYDRHINIDRDVIQNAAYVAIGI